MNKKFGGVLILCMLTFSSLIIMFQNSPFTPLIDPSKTNFEENIPNDDPLSPSAAADYSKQGDDVHNPRDLADFSELYYIYKNSTLIQANDTINSLISNLWDNNYKGFNDTDMVTARKRTYDNMLMLINLLDYNSVTPTSQYITYAKDIFSFLYNYLWENQSNLFLSYCDYNGSNPSPQVNSSDNALAIIALLKLYEATTNQTYLNFANLTYTASISTFYDSTNGGYYSSNLSGDTNKNTYDNLLFTLALAEIYRGGHLSTSIQTNALNQAENTLNFLITKFLNGSYGFFSSGDADWTNPSQEKSLLVNALAMKTLLSLYNLNFNQTYLDITVSTASFIDYAFRDSTGTYRGYNSTVIWDGSSTINGTKYLEANSLLLNSFLALFEKTYNSTYYLNANNISRFLNLSLWDSTLGAFNYSVDFNFISSNSSLKSTAANGWAIQALLGFRYSRPYLTRANTTMTLLTQYMRTNDTFNNYIMYDWNSLASQVLYTIPIQITLADIFEVKQPLQANLIAVYTLLELADETQLTDYVSIANKTMYALNESSFVEAFTENGTGGIYSTEINAWGLLALLKLYEKTNDSTLLETANKTWYFLRDNLYDFHNNGYNKSNDNEDSKDLLANCLITWANIEILRLNYSIFTNILINASNFVNQTINLLYQNMWDNVSYGFYNNATADWTPTTTGETVKRTHQNSIMIQTLLKYNNYFGNHTNLSQYNTRINQTVGFLLNHLWDSNLGGFFIGCNANGSSQNTDKYTYGNSWITSTFLKLFETTGNFTYYLLAEETINFINTYLWDFEYGGFHHYCSKDGEPYTLGTLDAQNGKFLISFKFIESLLSSVLTLTKLSAIKKSLPLSLIVDIEFEPAQVDRGAPYLQVTLNLIDIDGNPLTQANTTVSMSGFYKSINEEKLYGFASRDYFKNNINNYSINLDISAFLSNFHLTFMAINSSMAVTWLSISNERTFDVYLSRAFSLLGNLNIFFWDKTYGAYYTSFLENNTKYTFDNWMAVLAILEYYNASGINLMYNLTNSDLEQLLTWYVNQTIDFLNSSLLVNVGSSIAFFAASARDGTILNSDIATTDTALAIIALLENYRLTNNSLYLDMANRTWAFLNDSLWDSTYLGYIHVNGTSINETKYTIDNIWATLANLAIYNTPEMNLTIRNSALNMANLTINLLIQNVWDNLSLGYFSSFNGSTWTPFNTSNDCKQAEVNALAIQMFLRHAYTFNNSKRTEYISYANQTFLFMDQTMKDPQFLGYFTSTNHNGTIFNTNKTLAENCFMIISLLDLYHANNLNYSYYKIAEETLFYISRYHKNPAFTIAHNISSQFGAINFNPVDYAPIEIYSNFIFLRSLTKTDITRQTLAYPLIIDNITVEEARLGELQYLINMTIEVYDSESNPVENATIIGTIYGRYEVFNFTQLNNNTYYCLLNVSNLAGELNINLLAFKDGYSASLKQHTFSRTFPTYVQKSYETLIALFIQLWSLSDNIFYNVDGDDEYRSASNFMAMSALMDFIELGGNILWTFDWYSNRTFLSYSERIAENLPKILNTSIVETPSYNVSGYLAETVDGVPDVNYTDVASNALAVLSLLDLYDKTKDSTYLNQANNTWLFLNATFWDPVNLGFFRSNLTNSNKTLYDNCLAIMAALAINQTIGINSSIRAQAYEIANLTYSIMNQTFWDPVNGTYYSVANGDWSSPEGRFTLSNAAMILTSLKFYNLDPNQTQYLYTANLTADIFINNFYEPDYGGFYQYLLNNFSKPTFASSTDKYLIDNAWAILALANLYEITGNTSFYYKAEDTMNFVNSHLANHYNEYLNNEINDVNGYWDFSFKTGYVGGKPYGKYIGYLEGSATIIRAMLKLYDVANATLPWLNATVNILPPENHPLGDFCNLSIAIFDESDVKIQVDLNVTISGWKRQTQISKQEVIKFISYTYDSSSQEFKIEAVNLTGLDDIYITVYAKNASYATYWKEFYIHRTGSGFSIIQGVGGDYISNENYWQYTIGDDLIIIEALYTDSSTFQGIPSASVNFTIYYPNGTFWFSELKITNSSGWARIVFGPIPNIARLFGLYNATVYATHVNNTISPKTWYAPTSSKISINIDYGVSIPFFYPLEPIVSQGDIIQCNVTIKHRMLSNLSVDILIYSDGVLVPNNVTKNLTTGFNIFLIDVEIDERTSIGSHFIYINVSFENRVIRDTYFFITILSAIVIRNYYVPTWIAEDDIRYATIELEHRKAGQTSNISVKIDCPAIEVNSIIQVLQPLDWQEYYFPLIVKNGIPYGTYSGEIIVERVNYTLDYDDNPLTFQIEVKPPTQVITTQVPVHIVQQQQSMISIKIQNNKISPITIKLIGLGDGFTNFEEIYTIEAGQTETINTPISYFINIWDYGLREFTIEVYYFNESSQYSLISSNIYQITIDYSLNNILLGFFLPASLIAVAVFCVLWRRDKKKREQKKLK